MTRHELRTQVFKIIFQYPFYPEEMEAQIRHFCDVEYVVEKEQEESIFVEDPDGVSRKIKQEELDYIVNKAIAVCKEIPSLDEEINRVSKGWSINRMNKVDLSIIRLALYEMKFDDSVSVAVAINEAVELGKEFGGDNSSKFINGVLAKTEPALKAKAEAE